ncbi:MAG TPA: branched-chain amino acid ABC transporter substrate-binding protein [Aestuariivirgaceae bacterium]|nr:branched-chain amino acid ABC transporter substrate-binding protein [Aestuariivirgaceae bacterium]
MRKFLMAGVALGFGLAMTASTALADVQIGTAGPMTGQYASFGEQMKRGAEMAVAELNEAGGVNGEKLVLNIGDDACDPKQATAVANDFASKKVVFVAGHYCSGSSIPASAVYAEENIVQISPASTGVKYTDERPGKGVMRVIGRDDVQGVVAGNYLAKAFGDKKVAILDDKSTYGKGLADETRKALNAAGVTEAVNESYTAGEKDYTALVSKLKAANIDVVYVGGYHTEAGLILRQMRDQGLNALLVSGDALVTNEFWTITGPAGEGTLMTFAPDPRTNPASADLVKKFKDSGYDPEGYTIYTYVAVKVWAEAAKMAGSNDFDKVTDALYKLDIDTPVGKIRFDDKGDIKDPKYVWYKWSNGTYAEDPSIQ